LTILTRLSGAEITPNQTTNLDNVVESVRAGVVGVSNSADTDSYNAGTKL